MIFGLWVTAHHPGDVSLRQVFRDLVEQVRLARELGSRSDRRNAYPKMRFKPLRNPPSWASTWSSSPQSNHSPSQLEHLSSSTLR